MNLTYEDNWVNYEIAQHPERPNSIDYINSIFTDFIELKGDRVFGEDPAIIGGIASIKGIAVTVIGNVKGHTIEERMKTNFSMAKPEGYRKAIRLMKQAEKFNRPVICFVDTVGAHPGREAEERFQGGAIANCIAQAIELKVPIISVLIGDGGSGGAIALSVADYLVALEHSNLCVISPKACASILWKDTQRYRDAANMLRSNAMSLADFGVVNCIICEPGDGAHTNPNIMAQRISDLLYQRLIILNRTSINKLIKQRKKKFNQLGNTYIMQDD